MEQELYDRFIESWGSLGSLWGINRSMARIQAYIIMSEDPVDLDTVADRLNISRGNASMCLKELRNWGVIKRVHISGDRRDFYVTEPDVWKMFFNIAVERKKREFDPTLYTLRQLISEGDSAGNGNVQDRLTQMESIFSALDRILKKFLEDEKKSKIMLNFFENFTPK